MLFLSLVYLLLSLSQLREPLKPCLYHEFRNLLTMLLTRCLKKLNRTDVQTRINTWIYATLSHTLQQAPSLIEKHSRITLSNVHYTDFIVE